MQAFRSIIRIALVVAGLVCLLDGLLNAYRLYSLGKKVEIIFSVPIPGPFSRMGIGVALIALGLVLSGLIGRIVDRKTGTQSP
jgi:hypothetical protein